MTVESTEKQIFAQVYLVPRILFFLVSLFIVETQFEVILK